MLRSLIHATVSTVLTLGAAQSVSAQVVFNATTCGPIAADDVQFDGLDIVVDGCTLSIAGRHDFASLTLRNRAQLTHPPAGDVTAAPYPQIPDIGLDLDIAGDVNIPAGTMINLAGKGFGPGAGPGAGRSGGATTPSGGGGHGGNGGSGGATYGTYGGPLDAGSGGGGGAEAGAGGGALRLNVHGALLLGGSISANGNRANVGANRGGGAGGSVWINAGRIAGAGGITAQGGAGQSAGTIYGGGGAGGRIALFAGASTYTGTLRAHGERGNGGQSGGAGTSFTQLGATPTSLVLDNFGRSGATTDFVGMLVMEGNLSVARGARLSHPQGLELDLRVTGDAMIDGTSAFDVTGRGSVAATGDGRAVGAGGGGYGGTGGAAGGGLGFGSVENPNAFGSGGANPFAGGAGGGFAQLTVDGTLTVNGVIASNGLDARNPTGSGGGSSGGGSGGSILIRAATLAGDGDIVASGGSGREFGGGGSGGRVAVYSGASSFAGTLAACGERSSGGNRGGAGTIWQRVDSLPLGKLSIDNCGQLGGATTEFSGARRFEGDLFLSGGARLSHPPMQTLSLSFAGNVTIGTTGAFDVSGRGFAPGANPGPGTGAGGGGGGYGGAGGVYPNRVQTGGQPYGSEDAPIDFGSAGGGAGSTGTGGGAARLIAEGLLQIDGAVVAEGMVGGQGQNRGGGSGGSIFMTSGSFSLSPTGTMSVKGGDGAAFSGGGGGGRIRVTSCMAVTLAPEAKVVIAGGLQTGGVPSGADGTMNVGFGPTDPQDLDCDGVSNAIDNCPFFPNADQLDSGGVASPLDVQGMTPDGVGDACQCGDTNADGRVDSIDSTVLTRCLNNLDSCAGGSGLSGLPGGTAKCGVGGEAGCDASDADLIQRAVLGLGALEQACSAANLPVMP